MSIVEFHALPEELFALVMRWSASLTLFCAVVRFPPEEVAQFVAAENSGKDLDAGRISEIVVYRDDPGPINPPVHRFIRDHGDCVVVQFGGYHGNTLRQSSIGTKSEDPKILDVMRLMESDVEAWAAAGLWAVGPTGDVEFYRHARFTKRVAEACNRGLLLLAAAGDTVFSLQRLPPS